MGNFGMGEWLVVLVVVLVLFGGSKLPQLGDGLGKAIRNFKDASAGKDAPPAPAPKSELPPGGGAPGTGSSV